MNPETSILTDNLERQYDEVVSYIDGYRSFESRIINRLNPIRSPLRSLKFMMQFPKLWLEVNPLSNKSSDFTRTTVLDYATNEERLLITSRLQRRTIRSTA